MSAMSALTGIELPHSVEKSLLISNQHGGEC
jgi:hypothetical protein